MLLPKPQSLGSLEIPAMQFSLDKARVGRAQVVNSARTRFVTSLLGLEQSESADAMRATLDANSAYMSSQYN